MVKLDSVNDHEVGQVVLIWHIVSMPSNHVIGAVVLFGLKEMTLIFTNYCVLLLHIFIVSYWS
jgi:hypothetical protein